MNSKEFKNVFNDLAKSYDFEKAYSGWFKESPECIVVLDLQKSNFSNSYYLNIKIFVQGMLGNAYVKNKFLVKSDVGDIFIRQPDEYASVFDFNNAMEYDIRVEQLHLLFSEFIIPFINKALSKFGIKELAEKDEIFLLPAVKEQLYNALT